MNETEDSIVANVLIVEDEEDLADLYVEWLHRSFDVEVALNGEEALDHLTEDIDVVLLDRRLPDLGGDKVLEEIRTREIDCRVVIVSGVTPNFDVIDMGFDDYLEKPIKREELLSTVHSMVNRSEYSNSLQELHQLLSKVTILEENKDSSDLEGIEEFQSLKNRIKEIRSEIDKTLDEFDRSDFEATFKRIDTVNDDP